MKILYLNPASIASSLFVETNTAIIRDALLLRHSLVCCICLLSPSWRQVLPAKSKHADLVKALPYSANKTQMQNQNPKMSWKAQSSYQAHVHLIISTLLTQALEFWTHHSSSFDCGNSCTELCIQLAALTSNKDCGQETCSLRCEQTGVSLRVAPVWNFLLTSTDKNNHYHHHHQAKRFGKGSAPELLGREALTRTQHAALRRHHLQP